MMHDTRTPRYEAKAEETMGSSFSGLSELLAARQERGKSCGLRLGVGDITSTCRDRTYLFNTARVKELTATSSPNATASTKENGNRLTTPRALR